MKARHFMSTAPAHGPRKQRGTMLIIALIVLVAMTLAGIATMRSVDTATLMSGNIAFRQAALAAADQGIQAGFALLSGTKTSTTQNLNREGLGVGVAGYFSSASVAEPNWDDPAAWTRAAVLNGGAPDASGNTVYYIVERLCRIPNCLPGDTCLGNVNLCGSTSSQGSTSGVSGNDSFRPSESFGVPAPHYRITARAVGPRNAIAILQTLTR